VKPIDQGELEAKIMESIDFAKKKLGYTLVFEDWGNSKHKCACPMACVLLKENMANIGVIEEGEGADEVASVLGVSKAWVNSFIHGYDNTKDRSGEEFIESARELGSKIFSRCNPIDYYKFISDEHDADRIE
jgi:hypothetical protein